MSQKTVTVAEAKGRPMLVWVGKRPLTRVPAFPAQHVETFDPAGKGAESALADVDWAGWPDRYPRGGLLFHGDNKEVLAHLLANGFRGKVKLIYIDPPFDSGADYVRRVSLRGVQGTAKIEGEAHTLGEQIQYTDIWANDNYLQFMYERLLLLRELLAEDGSLYLHCDWNRAHGLRFLLEEVFGTDAVRNEIVWKRTSARSDSKTFNHIHDLLYFVTKGEIFCWNVQYTPYDQAYIEQHFSMVEPETGRRFKSSDLTARGLRSGSSGKPWRGYDPASKGNHWLTTVEKLDQLDAAGRIYWPQRGGWPRLKHYLDEAPGVPLQTIWTDISVINSQAEERSDYPTQKPEALLERIIRVSSNPGDLVLDCFMGSGTTAAVAQKLGRRWIACDINKGAIQTTSKRLQTIIREQLEAAADAQAELEVADGASAPPGPAQLSFTIWRVNDYDLQVQHNEAVELACEHIGIERTRADGFFDGVLGKKLVRIVPFNRPLTPLDLEEVKRELEARPEEDRDIVVVCLGKELAADAWVEDWNLLRKTKGAANRIEVIELRTDPKYGKFIQHRPAEARVEIARRGGEIHVVVKDFISPTILERLEMDMPLFRAKVPDWRSMVDCIMIDTSYDGEVFDVALSDVPERKQDLVAGTYTLPAPGRKKTTVAVKIIDMLGEEVLVTQRV